MLISNAACAILDSVYSNNVTANVHSLVESSISIQGLTIISGDSSTIISSYVANGGSLPAYQWQDSTTDHSWLNISNEVNPSISYTPLTTGDKIRCILTSNATCVKEPGVISNVLSFVVNVITPTTGNNGIKLYPNPVTTTLTIDSLGLATEWETLQIRSINGSQNIITQNINGLNKASINVAGLTSGMYTVIIRSKNGNTAYLKFIKL